MPFKPSAEKPISQFIAYCHVQCVRGFDNPWHKENWLKKFRAEIGLLNEHDSAVILKLHEHAGWNEKARTKSRAEHAHE